MGSILSYYDNSKTTVHFAPIYMTISLLNGYTSSWSPVVGSLPSKSSGRQGSPLGVAMPLTVNAGFPDVFLTNHHVVSRYTAAR